MDFSLTGVDDASDDNEDIEPSLLLLPERSFPLYNKYSKLKSVNPLLIETIVKLFIDKAFINFFLRVISFS